MNGIRLACLYSYGCQQVERKKVGKYLLSFLRTQKPKKKERDFIIKILKDLQSYIGYCHIKGLKKQKNPFTENTIRAYWLGDRSLETNNFNHNLTTLEKFKSIRISEHLPDWIIEGMLDCAISFGKVTKVFLDKAEVSNHRLLYEDGKVVFKTKTKDIDTIFIDNLEKGDLISIHWAIAREKISQDQAESLKIVTLKVLQTLKIA